MTWLETALSLSKEGKDVTIVEMLPFDRVIMSAPVVNMVALSMLMRQQGIKYLAETRLLEVNEDSVRVAGPDGKEEWMVCDNLVHALGMYPNKAEASHFEDIADEVYYTGDCAAARGNLWTATSSAHHIALEL